LKIGLITDSAADLPINIIQEYNITRIPMNIIFGENNYKIGKDISKEEYYIKLKKSKIIPSTSHPDPGEYFNAFQRLLKKESYDHIICVTVTKNLSSTYGTVLLIVKEFQDKITLIDSGSASGGQGLLVLAIAKMIKAGMALDSILNDVENLRKGIILVGCLYSLRNVYKSGRIKSLWLLIVAMLFRIKPVFSMDFNGKIKRRFSALFFRIHALFRLTRIAKMEADNSLVYDILIAHVNNPGGVKRLIRMLRRRVTINEIYISTTTPIVGTFAGQKAIILSLLPKFSD
jgi:DegV family protein with EDD domain